MDVDVSSFANTCENGICDPYESYESCTMDCSSGGKDDFCDEVNDGICDSDCLGKADIDCKGKDTNKTSEATATDGGKQEEIEPSEQPKEKSNYLVWILSALGIVILVFSFLFVKKKKQSQTMDSLKQYISENIRKGFTMQQIKDVLYREGYSEKEVDRAVKTI